MLILFSFLWKSFHIPLSWFYTGNWFFKPREIKKITFKDYCTPGSYILLLETVGQRIPESQYILMTKLIFRVQLVYYLYGHKKHWTLSNEPLFWLWFCDLLQYIFSLSYFLSCSKYEVKHLETLGKISLHNFISLRSSYYVFRKHGFVTLVYVNRIYSALDVLWLTFMCFGLGDVVGPLLVVRRERYKVLLPKSLYHVIFSVLNDCADGCLNSTFTCRVSR